MIALCLIIGAFLSVIYFPWQLSALVLLALAFVDPLGAIAVGLFADLLYYNPQAQIVPFFTIGSVGVGLLALFVRSRLRTGTL